MNRQQQNHRLRMDSCLSHWGRGLKFTLVRDPVVKAQQLFSWHGKTDCFCYRYPDFSLSEKKDCSICIKVSKGAKTRNGYNQVSHLTQDTNGKVTNSQPDITNESQEVSPFQAGDHKAHINNVKPSSWKRASALLLCTGRSNITMMTMWSSFEIKLGYITICEFITDCIKQYCETK